MDEIQRKLALIDDQLAGRTLRSRLVSTAPLFFPAVGLMAGILLQSGLPNCLTSSYPSALPWIWLGVAIPAAAAAFAVGIRSRLRPTGFAFIASFCFLCLGAMRLLAFETAAPSDIRHAVGLQRTLATIRGRILTQPYQQPRNWCFAQFASADPSTAFYLEMEAMEGPHGWQPANGTIRVHVDEPAPALAIGDYITAYCWLHRFEEPTNPGQFNVAAYLRLKNVHVGASVPAREAIAASSGPRDILTTVRKKLTDAATRGLLDDPPSDTQGEAILEALLLGERRNIDPDTYEAFRKTGLLHFVSLSGMHMGILVGMVWWLCKTAGLAKPQRALVCIIATGVFLLIVPPRAPAVRAAVIVWAYCGALLLRRHTEPLNSLCLAAIILLLVRPTQLFEVGWQLSFASVAGVLVLTERIESLFREKMRGGIRKGNYWAHPVAYVLRNLIDRGTIRLFSTGVAAWIGGAGILLYHFFTITPLASVWTVLVFPLISLILVMGFVKVVLFSVLPTLSGLLGICASFVADGLILVVKLIARLDINCILIGHVGIGVVVIYYGLVLFTPFGRTRHVVLKKWLCIVWGLTLIGYLGVVKWQRTHHDHLSITCLDVGHGQAILARLPGTMNILFDAGSLYGSDVGTRIIVPFLDHEGIGRLHAVVVSHRDIDHINGLPEVVDRRRVDCVYFDDVSFTQSQDVETIQVLMDHLRNRRVRAECMPANLDAGAARIQTLWPTEESGAREELGDNDKSLVCLIEYAGRKVLLCSDVEKLAQQEILSLYPALKSDVVVIPHHGSVRTLDDRFLERLDPEVLLCSCGARDYEQGRVVRSPSRGDLRITARDGAVSVCIDHAGMIQTRALKQH